MNIASGGKNQRNVALMILLVVNLSATILHYSDNFLFFDKYPAPVWMQPHHVYIAWLVLAPFSLIGYILYTKRNFWAAYLCLFIYSLTSTGGIAHYFFGSVAAFSTKMHVFIWFEELTGWILLGFIFWSSLIRKEWSEQLSLQ